MNKSVVRADDIRFAFYSLFSEPWPVVMCILFHVRLEMQQTDENESTRAVVARGGVVRLANCYYYSFLMMTDMF